MFVAAFSCSNNRGMGLLEVIIGIALFAVVSTAMSREIQALITHAKLLEKQQTLLSAHLDAVERLNYGAASASAEVADGPVRTSVQCDVTQRSGDIELRKCRVRTRLHSTDETARELLSEVLQAVNAE